MSPKLPNQTGVGTLRLGSELDKPEDDGCRKTELFDNVEIDP
jgi:hypothetical protein